MNNAEFEQIVVDRLEACKETLTQKNKEYSSATDRLHNFKVAARIDNETSEKALWGMYKKHLVSIMDLVEFPGDATPDLLNEKITDAINYHLLLEALLRERLMGNADWDAVLNHRTDSPADSLHRTTCGDIEHTITPCAADPLGQNPCHGDYCSHFTTCINSKRATSALRKPREAKDAAVRAKLHPGG
ncbi:MAG: hypothetical protein JSV82_02340 [Planctomycetota bacterium]|nr:MAG: hypothetical protein JSV82_02340 [Planctomycetota bacterium]